MTMNKDYSCARGTDRYDEFEARFLTAIETLVSEIKAIQHAHAAEEYSTPAPARHTKAYSEFEAEKIRASARKISAMTDCFFHATEKLADQVASPSRPAPEQHCSCSCNHEKELTAFERAVLEHLAGIEDEARAIKRHLTAKPISSLTLEEFNSAFTRALHSETDEPASTQTQE